MRELVARCLAFDRAQRPRTREARSTLERELLVAQSGAFDVFLSHAWGARSRRKPLTDALYSALRAEGLTVWLDSNLMGADLQASMRAGIASSGVVVVLVSPDYARSENCMFELRAARDSGKPVVACVVEPGFWTTWALSDGSRALPDDHELVALARLRTHLFVDLGEASRVDWQREPVTAEERRRLTHAPEALPRLLKHIKDAQQAPSTLSQVPAVMPPWQLPVGAPALPPSARASARKAAVALAAGAGSIAGAGAGAAAALAPAARSGAMAKAMSWRG